MSSLSKFYKRNLIRDIKHFIFLRKGLTQKPSNLQATTSDLFPIRNGDGWNTQFELLNVRGLIQGFSAGQDGEVILYFFNADGEILGIEKLIVNEFSRNSMRIPLELEKYTAATTFSVFHRPAEGLANQGSILAERGYTGYEYMERGLRGYVHGNLDAVALDAKGELICIGNKGFFTRSYLVQHLLQGPATYEFFVTNPTNSEVTVRLKLRDKESWSNFSTARIPTRGIHNFLVNLAEDESRLAKFDSRMYMCRPVVFRTTTESMDVFHG